MFLFVAYWPISCLQYSMKFDIMDWFYPMRFLIGECLQNGVLPIWNPYINLGYPLHVDPQSGALYPIVWIIGNVFGYSPFTINLEFFLHIVFAFFGMKKLSEVFGICDDVAIIVGVGYACCGFFVGNAQHLSWIISAAWIPFVFYYYRKLMLYNAPVDALGLALFSFLLLTGGYPAFIITTFYLLLIAFLIHWSQQLYKKEFTTAWRFLANNFLFVLIFALQGITFLAFLIEGLPYMVRADGLSLEKVQMIPFSPQSYLSFVLPFATGGNKEFFQTAISMANGYFGLLGLLFFGLAFFIRPQPKIFLTGFAGVAFLIAAMGDHAFLRAWLYHYVPMMNLFMYPSLFRLFALLCFLLLFGIALQKYWRNEASEADWKRLKVLGYILLLVLLGIFLFAVQKSALFLPAGFSAKAITDFIAASNNSQMVLIQAPIQIALLAFLLFIIQKKRDQLSKYLVIIIALDLFLSVQLNLFITAASEQSAPQLQAKVRQLPKGFPIPKEDISANMHFGDGEYYPVWYNNNMLLKKIAFDGYNNFKIKNFKQFNDSPGKIEKLRHPLVYVENVADTVYQNAADFVEIESFSPANVKAKVSLPSDGRVVFLQSDYPGWEVRLNDRVIPHFQKEEIFISAEIPAGDHQLEFNFYPANYLLYQGISLAAIFFTVCCLLFFTNKNPGSINER